MTGQRIFPFIVNGQHWKDITVEENLIKRGYVVWCVSQETPMVGHEENYPIINMKQIVFKSVECGHSINNQIAHWVPVFWVVDDFLYIDKENNLWTK